MIHPGVGGIRVRSKKALRVIKIAATNQIIERLMFSVLIGAWTVRRAGVMIHDYS